MGVMAGIETLCAECCMPWSHALDSPRGQLRMLAGSVAREPEVVGGVARSGLRTARQIPEVSRFAYCG